MRAWQSIFRSHFTVTSLTELQASLASGQWESDFNSQGIFEEFIVSDSVEVPYFQHSSPPFLDQNIQRGTVPRFRSLLQFRENKLTIKCIGRIFPLHVLGTRTTPLPLVSARSVLDLLIAQSAAKCPFALLFVPHSWECHAIQGPLIFNGSISIYEAPHTFSAALLTTSTSTVLFANSVATRQSTFADTSVAKIILTNFAHALAARLQFHEYT